MHLPVGHRWLSGYRSLHPRGRTDRQTDRSARSLTVQTTTLNILLFCTSLYSTDKQHACTHLFTMISAETERQADRRKEAVKGSVFLLSTDPNRTMQLYNRTVDVSGRRSNALLTARVVMYFHAYSSQSLEWRHSQHTHISSFAPLLLLGYRVPTATTSIDLSSASLQQQKYRMHSFVGLRPSKCQTVVIGCLAKPMTSRALVRDANLNTRFYFLASYLC